VAEEKLAEALAYAELLESVYAEFLDIPMYQAWLRVEVNQEFVIPLVSNPTTGYGWQASYDETMLELVEKTYEPGVAAKQGVVGAGGTELFRFRTLVERGQTEITLVYKQPWEEPSPDDVTKVFTVNIVPTVIPLPPITPVTGELTTQGYVYDDKLGYGFEYPGGWEFFINVDKDVEQCDPSLYYETYNCVDFPDENIKKVVSFEKKILKDGAQFSVAIELTVKSATDLQEVKDEIKQGLEMSGLPILDEATILVNNISGYDILSGTPTWKLRQVVFFANGMAYTFKYSSQEEFYRMYEETFNNIINSFIIE